MSARFKFVWYVLVLCGAFGAFLAPATAVPPGPYNSAMTTLAPVHWYQMDDDGFAAIGATAATAVDSGSALIDGTYVTISGQTFAGPTIAQGGGSSSFAVIGRSVGPTKMSKFSAPEINAGTVADQNAGMIPDLQFPADPTTPGFNRVFEPNLRAGIRLPDTNAQFSGDAVTGAITVAGWFRNDSANTGSTIRMFDSGANTGTQQFFQITSGGTSGLTIGVGDGGANSRTLRAFYPSGTPASSVGGDRGVGDSGQWYFLVVSTTGTTNADRAANIQVWERYADKTNAMQSALVGLGPSNAGAGDLIGGVRQAHIGYRDASVGTNLPLTGQMISGEVDEVGIWNRVLQYDERESLYVSAVTPIAGAIVNTTTADGNWADASKWSTGTWPLQHGANQGQYYGVVVDNNILATTFDNAAGGTNTFRSNMASLTVNAAKTLTLASGATVRTSEDVTVSGNVAMNGAPGVFSTTAGAKDFNASQSANVEAGRNLTLGAGSSVTMASQGNRIRAEGNVTLAGPYTLTAYDNAAAGYTTGAHLDTVVLADFDAGSGSLLQEAGVLSGQFSSHTLPGGGGSIGDPLGRRVSVLYENRSPTGAGVVDAMKIGFAQGGDLDFNNIVDFTDAFTFTGNYGIPAGADWRDGDFDNNGAVGFSDAIELVANYGFPPYATTVGTAVDGILTLYYDNTTGNVMIEGPLGQQFNTLSITSAAGLLNPGQAAWLPGGPPGITFQSDTPNTLGFATLTAAGGTFLPQNGYVIGQILDPSLSYAQLLQDLTITYSIEGIQGTRPGNLVPEPSSVVLLAVGLVGLSAGAVVRRRRTAKA